MMLHLKLMRVNITTHKDMGPAHKVTYTYINEHTYTHTHKHTRTRTHAHTFYLLQAIDSGNVDLLQTAILEASTGQLAATSPILKNARSKLASIQNKTTATQKLQACDLLLCACVVVVVRGCMSAVYL